MDDSGVDQDYPRQDRRRWTREKTDLGETMQSEEDGCDQVWPTEQPSVSRHSIDERGGPTSRDREASG